jgi:deoxyribonuclease-1
VATGSVRGKNDSGETVWEPPDAHKGNVARAMFYMSVRYWWSIPDDMEEVLKRWHAQDPVDDAERARNLRIEAIQHNLNPFIVSPELVETVPDY